MNYKYTYKNTGFELWQLSMYYTYGSMVGVCNIIFTAAVVTLTVAKWNSSGNLLRFGMILAICLFTLIQPMLVYLKARKQASGISEDTEICFDDDGIHVKIGEKILNSKWNTIKKISKKPTMIIVFSDTTHGFVLTNRVLGKERKAFYSYIISRINMR